MMSDTYEQWSDLIDDETLLSSLPAVVAGSQYVSQWVARAEDAAKALVESGDLSTKYDSSVLATYLAAQLNDVTDELQLQSQLRQFRQREMVRIIWRDLAGWADLAETVRDLSTLADECIEQALNLLHQWQSDAMGLPCNEQGEEQELMVIGMGKLGAGELNLSSDIDLIFAYPEEGYTQGGRKQITNEEYFTRLGRKLIQALDNVTADGFVFRVDMRLRPFGDSGALAASFESLENYYQTQGREWERYAMIKARVITGDKQKKQQLVDMLRPFVYRRYLDYGVFESLREMKVMIARQLRQKGMEDNIKLGAGGIREIEFIGQVFQLIYGGRDQPLQQRPILTILDALAERQLLSDYAVEELKSGYDFLRRTEHRIQAWADQQTHMLPNDEAGKQRISHSMGFQDWYQFEVALMDHRQRIQQHFEQLLTSPQAEDETKQEGSALFSEDQEQKLAYLADLGFEDAQSCLEKIDKVLTSHSCNNLTKNGRERLEQLLPLLVQASVGCQEPDICLERVLPLIESVMRRTVYMSLLVENPLALSQLIRLCSASPWISKQLVRYPVLLDELLDSRRLLDVPNKAQQQNLLNVHLSVADAGDLERHMYLLREFKQIAALHVAAADVSDSLPLMRVGDQLTELAELMLAKVFELAWAHLVDKHGYGTEEIHGTELRRARLGFQGKIYDMGYKFEADFAGGGASIKDAYVSYGTKLDGNKFGVKFGQSHVPFGLNTKISSKYMTFMDRPLFADTDISPARESGAVAVLADAKYKWMVSAGLTNGAISGGGTNDNGSTFAARASFLPYQAGKNQLIQVGAGYLTKGGGDDFRFRQRLVSHEDKTRHVDTGTITDFDGADAFTLDAMGVFGSFHTMAEYVNYDIDRSSSEDIEIDGFAIEAGYFLTGESLKWKKGYTSSITPKSKSGAWQIGARFETLEIDDAANTDEVDKMSFAINYYPTKNTRFKLDFDKVLDLKVNGTDVDYEPSAIKARAEVFW